MSEPTKRVSGKIVVIAIVSTIVLGAGLWVGIESQMPILDKDAGKRVAAEFEKRCMKELPREKCREIVGKRHTECLLRSASKDDRIVNYDLEMYVECIDESRTRAM